MKNMGYGIRDSVKAAAAVLCLVNAALLAILLMSAFDLHTCVLGAENQRFLRRHKVKFMTVFPVPYLPPNPQAADKGNHGDIF